MNIAVVGTGYVGLVTGACLAEIGHRVICIDNNPAKVSSLQQGKMPIYEPGLEAIVLHSVAAQRLSFTTELASAIPQADVIFIAVGTPALPSGDPDLRYVESAARAIGRHLDGRYRVIVNKSTVPIGSGDWVRMILLDGAAQGRSPVENVAEVGQPSKGSPTATLALADLPQFDVVSNPEFLREGSAIWDTFNPDRIVVGSSSGRAIDLMRQLYEPIVQRRFAEDPQRDPVPFVVTDLASAEMIKYAANALLATKISFINEIANICERVGGDVQQVALGIGLDSRIGSKFLNAGLGWGGSCFPKDISALLRTASDYGYQARILESVIAVNQDQRQRVIEKLQQLLKVLKGKTVGLLGLTFKPNTDDLRDAPALTLIQQLSKLGAKVKGFDPVITPDGIPPDWPTFTLEANPMALAQDCDALVLVTEWSAFQTLDWVAIASQMRRPVLVDGRNALNRATLEAAGFVYIGVGR
ncbi:MAG: UDP-glucose/GDP-mannose dehydrogenase family protein [Cyanobacteriota bacterium]|nr:UDP-glucose/GDP-mannose dehydrogenase family protein [Cyanobacteriota bacterium]